MARSPPSRGQALRTMTILEWGKRISSFSEHMERKASNAPGERGDRQASDNGGPVLMPDVEQHAREGEGHDQGRADAASHIDDPAQARAHPQTTFFASIFNLPSSRNVRAFPRRWPEFRV